MIPSLEPSQRRRHDSGPFQASTRVVLNQIHLLAKIRYPLFSPHSVEEWVYSRTLALSPFSILILAYRLHGSAAHFSNSSLLSTTA